MEKHHGLKNNKAKNDKKILSLNSARKNSGKKGTKSLPSKAAHEKLLKVQDEQEHEVIHPSGITSAEVIQACLGGDHPLSRLVVHLNRGRFCKDLATGTWKKFDGVVWKDDHHEERLLAVVELSELVAHEHEKMSRKKDLEQIAKAIGKVRGRINKRTGMMTLSDQACVGTDGLGIAGERFDCEQRYIGAQNGTVDLQTGELLEGNPELYITKQTGVEYDPNTGPPEKFLATLKEIFEYTLLLPEKPVFPEEPDSNGPVDLGFSLGDKDDAELEKWKVECDRIQAQYEEELAHYEERRLQVAQEIIDYLQVFLGYALTACIREHVILVLEGDEGRNGKGILVRTIMNILGDYGGEVRPELLLRGGVQGSSSATPEIMDLKGKRFVVASETNQGSRFDTSVVKRLTGGDAMTGRPLYGSEVRFRPSHTLALQTNFAPNAMAEDTAFWRRMRVIKFNRVFVDDPNPDRPMEAQINKALEEELVEEYPAILKWMVEGAVKYYQEGLHEPEIMKKEVVKYRMDTDVLSMFIKEYCIKGKEGRIQSSHFTRCLNRWLVDNGFKKLNQRTIIDRMRRQGYQTIKSNVVHYTGIMWNSEGERLLESTVL